MIGDCSLEDILMILLFGIFTKISMNKIKEDEDEAWWIAVKIIYEVFILILIIVNLSLQQDFFLD